MSPKKKANKVRAMNHPKSQTEFQSRIFLPQSEDFVAPAASMVPAQGTRPVKMFVT